MKEIKSPERYKSFNNNPKIFLAGSIEMGTAINWQLIVATSLESYNGYILNPRRDDWDSSWKQELNNPQFYEQVTWELDMLDACDYIFMYYDPATKSPISLLELGLHACGGSKSIIVCCPDGFWRKGNVDIVCQRYNIPVYSDFETAIVALKSKLN
jgi:hypothetical protein